jgi:glycosyltransferase involved in cell wall biosynthesis
MKIGFDAKRAFLNEAGLGTYSRNTLVALQKYYPQNQYTLFTPAYRTDLFKEYMFFDIVKPENFLSKTFNPIWRSFFLSQNITKNKPDLFHGLSNELPAGIHRSNIPAVVTIHDLIFMNFPGFYKSLDRKIYYEKVKYACKAAQRIIAISKQTQSDLIHHLGVNPEKVEVIYQNISERFFLNHYVEDADEVLARYHLPSKFILTVGTIEHRKNQLKVIKALHRYGIDIPYVIVGRATPYTDEIRAYIAENRLKDKVIILNKVPDFDLPALYQQALCLVYLSHYEGFGLPVVEAMACGCPVITSSVSSLPEIGGDAALYCNPDDEECLASLISKVAGNLSLRKEMTEKGKKQARMFHPESRIDLLMAFYRKVARND